MARALTVEQVAEYLQLSPYTVREWIRQGKLPGRKIGRVYRVVDTELREFIAGSFRQAAEGRNLKLRAADVLGMFADLPFSTEDLKRCKREEIKIEESRLRERFKR